MLIHLALAAQIIRYLAMLVGNGCSMVAMVRGEIVGLCLAEDLTEEVDADSHVLEYAAAPWRFELQMHIISLHRS